MLDKARPDHPPNVRNDANAQDLGNALEVGDTEGLAVGVLAHESPLDFDRAGVQERGDGLDGQFATIAGDLGSVVDEVGGDVGVFRFGNLLLEVEEVAEVGQGRELLTLGRVPFGACRATKGVIFARFGCGESGNGGEEKGNAEGRQKHVCYFGESNRCGLIDRTTRTETHPRDRN